MEEKELQTSLKQRIAIIAIAIIMLGSIIAGYVAIVANSGNSSSSSSETEISEEKIAEYEEAYDEKLAKFQEASAYDYSKFMKYLPELAAYNESTANSGGVKTKDLRIGNGRELGEGDTNYLAYYVGWCADETVFDSSVDNMDNPTSFTKALDASLGMIEGWNAGVVGMKLGGIREITIPSDLAYGDQMEICGGLNKPLKFVVMAVANEDPLKSAAAELDDAYMRLQYAYYGVDYDSLYSEQ